jgi:hypothetical protein
MKSLDMQGRFPDWANYSAVACSSIFSCSAAGCKRSLTIAGGSTRLARFLPVIVDEWDVQPNRFDSNGPPAAHADLRG